MVDRGTGQGSTPSALTRRIEAARALVRPAWDESRAGHLLERTAARQRRARIARGVGYATLAVAAGVLLAWSTTEPTRSPGPSVATASEPSLPHAEAPSGTLRFADGSLAVPLADETELVVDAARASGIALELAH